MLQNIFLSTAWKDGFYSISSFLFSIGLFSPHQQQFSTRLKKVEDNYSQRICIRLKSAIVQIQKKGLADIPYVVGDLDTFETLTEDEARIFRRLKTEVLTEFHAETERDIFVRGLYPYYQNRLSAKTVEILGRQNVNERY